MPNPDILAISYAEYEELTEKLAQTIYVSSWQFDHILCLARGGLRVGDLLSRLFAKPLAVLATRSYQGQNENLRGKLTIGQQIAMTSDPPLQGKLLVVDDLVDSGHTLAAVTRIIPNLLPEVESFRTAVLWWKACSVIAPNYYGAYLPDNPWIQQPFEKYDRFRIADLVKTTPLN